MPLTLNVPNTAHSLQTVSLGGIDYDITYTYNTRDSRWRMDISKQGVVVKSGIKIMENQSLLGRYLLSNFEHGDIFCVRVEKDSSNVGRDNLGLDKAYELVYYTNEELSQL